MGEEKQTTEFQRNFAFVFFLTPCLWFVLQLDLFTGGEFPFRVALALRIDFVSSSKR